MLLKPRRQILVRDLGIGCVAKEVDSLALCAIPGDGHTSQPEVLLLEVDRLVEALMLALGKSPRFAHGEHDPGLLRGRFDDSGVMGF